jgi:hypothetical protein
VVNRTNVPCDEVVSPKNLGPVPDDRPQDEITKPVSITSTGVEPTENVVGRLLDPIVFPSGLRTGSILGTQLGSASFELCESIREARIFLD